MDLSAARPKLLKEMNLSLVRTAIRACKTATRAELAAATGVSATTIRTLLEELLNRGEIALAGRDESSGGRKAERYRFCPDRCHGVAFCMRGGEIHALVVNLCGEIEQTALLRVGELDLEHTMAGFIVRAMAGREIRAIGIGGPGVVEGDCFLRVDPRSQVFYQEDVGARLSRRFGLPVVLENDVNATAIGFGRCYQRSYPQDGPADMAYLHFEAGCVSGGFLSAGCVVRGARRFAGELGLAPMEDGRTLDQWMGEDLDERAYCAMLIKIIGWTCGFLNPQYVALGGSAVRKECLGPIGDGLSALLPRQMQAELLYAPDVWHDYRDGMACLTAEKLLEGMQLVQL